MGSYSKAPCEHFFEQSNYDRERGQYVTCAKCRQIAASPDYAVCIRCHTFVCVHCIIYGDLTGLDEAESVWSDGTEPDYVSPWEEVTDKILIVPTPKPMPPVPQDFGYDDDY